MECKLAGLSLTPGGSINWTPAFIVQASATRDSSIGLKRQLAMHALWKFNFGWQQGCSELSSVVSSTYTTQTLRWELKD